MSPTSLTIVIPVFNREALIQRTLSSISRQSLRPLDVVLIDNNSSDSSLSIMKKWQLQNPDINVIIDSEKIPGAAAARQHGLELVRTQWTMFFDSDDTMEPNHCRQALYSAQNADLVGWDVNIIDKSGNRSIKKFPVNNLQFHSLFHGATGTQRYMARTALFRKAGGWNPSVRYWDDIELGARILNLNPRVVKVIAPPPVTIYSSDDSITGPLFSSKIPQALHALSLIANTLGHQKLSWIDLKTTILAADSARENSPSGKKLLNDLLSNPSLIYGDSLSKNHKPCAPILKLAYLYRKAGGRGIARILQPFLTLHHSL
ncbi:MAG: glycosyltransferase family 2 protein [Muribaculum sp.]|nr:glycosyltransferase family 2 protein [Muribaculum sp.]